MVHCINALIGGRPALAPLIERFGPPDPTELPFGLVIVPLDERRLDALAMSNEPPLDGFTYLNPAMAREIANAMSHGRALYIETEYFGGTGGQSAALFESGTLAWKAAESTLEPAASRSFITRLFKPSAVPSRSPISEGLAKLGVVPSTARDEFDQVGLGRFRSLEAFGLDCDE